jgi:hypothetical protein
LVEQLQEDHSTIVGIDHGFSSPTLFSRFTICFPDWPTFLDDFQRHWPTDDDHVYVDFHSGGLKGNGATAAIPVGVA